MNTTEHSKSEGVNSTRLPFTTAEEILKLAEEFPTPFYLYDEKLIQQACKDLKCAFNWLEDGFKNYFAVKATPNPNILRIVKDEGFGYDCSSLTELKLAEAVSVDCSNKENDIYFTSNNTPIQEFRKAKELGAIINLDDISHIQFIHKQIGLPEHISFRFNPGILQHNKVIASDLRSSKFGMTKDQIFEGISMAKVLGVIKFSLHTMMLSNCIDVNLHSEAAKIMFELVLEIKEMLGIRIESVNLGGGIGIPYDPQQDSIDLNLLSQKIKHEYDQIIVKNELTPLKIFYECGRYITGPAGILVTRIIHHKQTFKSYIGVDASMANLMRPSLYNAYHEMTVITDQRSTDDNSDLPSQRTIVSDSGVFDVVGSLCENNDKLATDRYLGKDVAIGDLIVIHNTGAHGHAMGFNYNGKLRSAEYLRRLDGSIVQIRKAETYEDLVRTVIWND